MDNILICKVVKKGRKENEKKGNLYEALVIFPQSFREIKHVK